jgi:YidC/Oxa1 family membrane protein insertase
MDRWSLRVGFSLSDRVMEQRRFVTFFAFAMGLMLLWQMVIIPKFFPQLIAKPNPAAAVKKANGKDAAQDDAAKVAAVDGAKPSEPGTVQPADVAADPAKPKGLEFPDHPPRVIRLGSIEAASPFRMLATFSTRGATISQIELSSPRYRELENPAQPLRVLRPGPDGELSLETAIPSLPVDLTRRHWEVVEELPDSVTFRMASSTPGVEFVKRYSLKQAKPGDAASETAAYQVAVEFTLKNTGDAARTLDYELLGPASVPLENIENTTKFRDIAAGFKEPTYINTVFRAAATIAGGDLEDWSKPLAFIGTDVQYFAALLFPIDDQAKTPYFKVARQELLGPNLKEKSEVTVRMKSVDLDLAPGQSKTHGFMLYAGPKSETILPAVARDVVQHGRLGWLSRPMLGILNLFHTLTASYGLAIIGLTIVVRTCMLPLSLKQAKSAAVMQEVQKKIAPEMELIKKNFANDQQKQSQAIMELYRKHNFNPFSMLGGCLLVFLQLPIFMALYSALNLSIDLRQAPFLWIQNLAAPDALFQFPFRIPLLGWKEFNLLPFVTIGLFLAQQKLFMPPAANEEQALQYKMMNFMTAFMGIMFYRVPAGLCIYFIASSLWGIAERKLLPKPKIDPIPVGGSTGPAAVVTTTATRVTPTGKSTANGDKKEPGFIERLLQMADKEQQLRRDPPTAGKKKKR